MSLFRAAAVIAAHELRRELRSRERVPAMLLFSALVLLVMHFAVGLDGPEAEALAPGVLWVAFLLAGTLGLYRSFAPETEAMAIHGLMLGPTDRSAIYFGKLGSGAVLLFSIQVPVIGLYELLFQANLDGGRGVVGLLVLGLVFLCGSFAFLSLGVTVAAICASTPVREVLLPLLLFPLAAPLLIAGVTGARAAAGGEPTWEAIRFLLLASAAFVAVSAMVFDAVLEE